MTLERDRGSIPEHKQNEVWELTSRAEETFMPIAPRPMGRVRQG